MDEGGAGGEINNMVFQAFEDEQLGRNFFLLFLGLSIGLLANNNSPAATIPLQGCLEIVAVSIGVSVLWIGLLLKMVYPRISVVLKLAGVSILLLAFFGYLCSRLPKTLIWLPVVCFALCLIPVVAAASSSSRFQANKPPTAAGLNEV